MEYLNVTREPSPCPVIDSLSSIGFCFSSDINKLIRSYYAEKKPLPTEFPYYYTGRPDLTRPAVDTYSPYVGESVIGPIGPTAQGCNGFGFNYHNKIPNTNNSIPTYNPIGWIR